MLKINQKIKKKKGRKIQSMHGKIFDCYLNL